MKRKSILAIYAASVLLSVPSANAINIIDDIICDKTTNTSAKQAETSRLVRDARGANISYSLNLPTIQVGNFGLNFGGRIETDLGNGGKYVGADLWKLHTGFNFLGAGTEVAFVRQYPNRDQALCRLPVDVTNLIPTKASDFKKADGMKPGDLISFKTHLTLGVPGLSTGLIDMKPPIAVSGIFEVQIFMMTEDLVRVRISGIDETNGNLGVKIGLWETGPDVLTPTFEIKAIESNRAKLLVWDYVFNVSEKLENSSGVTASDVYNNFIGSQMQVELTQLLGTHFSHALENLKVVATGSIQKSKKIQLVKQIETIAKEDLSKPEDQRRVIEVSRGGLQSSSMSNGFKFNFLRLFRVQASQTEYQSLLWYADENNAQTKFVLHGTSKDYSYKALKIRGATMSSDTALILNTTPDADFDQFTAANKQIHYPSLPHNQNAGEDFNAANQQNIERFKNINLTGIYGIRAGRFVDFKSINAGDTSEVFAIMNAMLATEDANGKTNSILDNMEWQVEKDTNVQIPDWDKFKATSHSNLKIRQDLMFKKELFQQKNLLPTTDLNVGERLVYQKVIDTLVSLGKRGYKLNSVPVSSDRIQDSHNLDCGQLIVAFAGPYWSKQVADGNYVDQNICFRNAGNYVRAFQEDAVNIGKFLSPILVEKENHTLRYGAYRKLIQIPLFMEIGGLIMMNVAESAVTAKGLNANLLKKFFVMRLTVESQGKPSHVGYYPDKTEYSRIDRLNQILSYQSYLTDRSYKLDQYIHPDGRLRTLKEILAALDIPTTPSPLIRKAN